MNILNIPFTILQTASGAYLCDLLPDDWESLSGDQQEDYLIMNAWEPLEGMPAADVFDLIESHAQSIVRLFEYLQADTNSCEINHK